MHIEQILHSHALQRAKINGACICLASFAAQLYVGWSVVEGVEANIKIIDLLLMLPFTHFAYALTAQIALSKVLYSDIELGLQPINYAAAAA